MTLLSMSSPNSVDRAPARCLRGHGFDSCRGLRIYFFVPLSYHVDQFTSHDVYYVMKDYREKKHRNMFLEISKYREISKHVPKTEKRCCVFKDNRFVCANKTKSSTAVKYKLHLNLHFICVLRTSYYGHGVFGAR